MFPDYLVIRIVLRSVFGFFHSIAPISIIYTSISLILQAPPLVLLTPQFIPISLLVQYETLFNYIFLYCSTESLWFIYNSYLRSLLSTSQIGINKEGLSTEERWRIWIKILESDEDPWSLFKGGFTKRGKDKVPRGMGDDAVDVNCEEIGRTNVMMYIAHFYFDSSLENLLPGSLERDEINSMVLLLELAITQSRSRNLSVSARADTEPFQFRYGKSQHHIFLLYDEPMSTSHHPLLFYFLIQLASESANFLLFLFGFRFYPGTASSKFSLFPLFFMRSSRSSLDKLKLYKDHQSPTEAALADKVGYWFHPGSKTAKLEDLTPILFMHGISGTYGPTIFILLLRFYTGRALFLPEFPYVTMRLSPPSRILGRRETAAAARRMLWRHGFSLTEEEDEAEDWRRGRVILVAHSLGSGPCGWVLRDAPDICAGAVLIDPMSVMLSSPWGPRNFFKTDARTAAEIFFKFFAREKGINHFLARILRSSDAGIFGPKPVVSLESEECLALMPKCCLTPLDPPYSVPNYAPYLSPSPLGPFPTVFFYSAKDCVLNVPKIKNYLEATGFDSKTLRIMPGEHASVLISLHWSKEISKAINEVALAAEILEIERE